jgi:hypothetical protein
MVDKNEAFFHNVPEVRSHFVRPANACHSFNIYIQKGGRSFSSDILKSRKNTINFQAFLSVMKTLESNFQIMN